MRLFNYLLNFLKTKYISFNYKLRNIIFKNNNGKPHKGRSKWKIITHTKLYFIEISQIITKFNRRPKGFNN